MGISWEEVVMNDKLFVLANRVRRCRRSLVTLAACCLLHIAGSQARAAAVTVLDSNDANLTTAAAIETDGTTLYMSGTNAANNPAVFSLPKAGGSVTQLYSHWGTSACCANGVTVVGPNLFWIDPNSGPVTDTQIFSAPKIGGGSSTAIYTGSLVGQPIVDGSDIASDGSKLYTADYVQGRIDSLNTNGSGLVQLGPNRYGGFFNEENLNKITVADGTLFVADDGRAEFPDTPPRIESIPTAGATSFTELFDGPVGTTRAWAGITSIGSVLYLTEGSDILDIPMSGGIPVLFLTDPRFGTLQGITSFDDTLYVAGTDSSGKAAVFEVSLAPVLEPGSAILVATSVCLLIMWRVRSSRIA
jgi:hypothetical protein